jgi:hypothetical protein
VTTVDEGVFSVEFVQPERGFDARARPSFFMRLARASNRLNVALAQHRPAEAPKTGGGKLLVFPRLDRYLRRWPNLTCRSCQGEHVKRRERRKRSLEGERDTYRWCG